LGFVKRPRHLDPPDYLTPSSPVPEPGANWDEGGKEDKQPLDPTRYGDWEKKGVAIDF